MSEVKYTQDHDWLRLHGDGTASVGITDFAQKQLGDLVYVGLPEVGAAFEKGADAAVIESVKAASDLKMPVAGTIVEVNTALSDDPGQGQRGPTRRRLVRQDQSQRSERRGRSHGRGSLREIRR